MALPIWSCSKFKIWSSSHNNRIQSRWPHHQAQPLSQASTVRINFHQRETHKSHSMWNLRTFNIRYQHLERQAICIAIALLTSLGTIKVIMKARRVSSVTSRSMRNLLHRTTAISYHCRAFRTISWMIQCKLTPRTLNLRSGLWAIQLLLHSMQELLRNIRTHIVTVRVSVTVYSQAITTRLSTQGMARSIRVPHRMAKFIWEVAMATATRLTSSSSFSNNKVRLLVLRIFMEVSRTPARAAQLYLVHTSETSTHSPSPLIWARTNLGQSMAVKLKWAMEMDLGWAWSTSSWGRASTPNIISNNYSQLNNNKQC